MTGNPLSQVTLLDLDGCIVDSTQPILRSLGQALMDVGLAPITLEDLSRVVGPPLAETVPMLLAERDADHLDAAEVIRRYRDGYRTSSIDLALPYPGMDEAIDRLAEQGRIGVVTSKPLDYAEPILAALQLFDRFEIVEGPSLTESEGKTVTLGRALARLGVAGGPHIVMVGDRHHDIAAGRAHGTTTVGVTWGFGSAAELLEGGADRLAHRPDDLSVVVAEAAVPTRGDPA
jgi:phosphoglycolate phosphatase